jgi:drug/metabolite transporter superfamily protein YnfA
MVVLVPLLAASRSRAMRHNLARRNPNPFTRWWRPRRPPPIRRRLSIDELEARTTPDATLLHSLFPNPTGPQEFSQFGKSVATDGNWVVVSSPYADSGAFYDSGQAFVFDAATGALLRTLNNPAPAAYDGFGRSVAVSGNTVVVGASYYDDTSAVNPGSAYVFDATTGALLRALSNPTPEPYDSFGYSVAVSGNTVVVGEFYDAAVGYEGAVHVFDAATGALLRTLTNATAASGDWFGYSVAVSGNIVVVGAPSGDAGTGRAGGAYVFNVATGALLTTLTNPTPAADDNFGCSVAVSGGTVVVGALYDDTGAVNAGSAYVFDAATGALLTTLTNPTPAACDYFGFSVAVSGNTVVVGAPNDGTGAVRAGSAYEFDAITRALLRTLTNPTPAVSDLFGYSVAMSGNIVVVGACQDAWGARGAGSACVFDATTGALLQTLSNPAPSDFDLFGYSVAVSGNTVVVGARGDYEAAGSAYVFDATTGALLRTLSNPTPAAVDYFGCSVAVSGNTVVVGACGDDGGARGAGSAYVFDATTGVLLQTLSNPAPAEADCFGYSVAMSGNIVVVGAPTDSTATGRAGDAYVFDAATGALLWTPSSPTPTAYDHFGSSVAVSGNIVVVGAYYDGSAGGAYVFDATTGALLTTLTNPTPAAVDYFGCSVAVSGGTVVVGAPYDDTQNFDQGAAYVYNVNLPPVFTSNGGGATASVSVAENTTAVTTVTAADPNSGTTLTYSIIGGADAAKFQIDVSTGVLTFVTAPNYEARADANGDNVYEVTVQVSDGSLTDSQAISIAVTNVNEAPVAAGDSYTLDEGTTLITPAPGVLGNDADGDGDALTAVLVTGPAHGSLELKPDGSFTYAPAADWNGTDSFAYLASDGHLYGNVATVTITVSPVNESPTTGLVVSSIMVVPTDPPGPWTVDRFAPAGFTPGQAGDGRVGVVDEFISAADQNGSRPPAYNYDFCDVQGRKLGLPAGTTYVAADLYVPASWMSLTQQDPNGKPASWGVPGELLGDGYQCPGQGHRLPGHWLQQPGQQRHRRFPGL